MKTIEEKAKAYDKARECFKSFKEKYYTKDTILGDVIFDKTGEMQKDFEQIFPELRESEDEKIIEEIKFAVTQMPSERQDTKDKCLDWLEKQKEPKNVSASTMAPSCWQKEQKPNEFKDDELVEIIKGEFEGFRTLLKKKGIDYEPQRSYWEAFARLFDSSAREYVKEQKPCNDSGTDGDIMQYIEEGEKRGIKEVISFPEKYGLRKEQKPAWSEEDERILKGIIGKIDHDQAYGVSKVEMLSFLKRLRPSWKPSEEQMEALKKTAGGCIDNGSCRIIATLLEQLKKLCK